ncbi:MAG: hypothetical protein WC314_23475 [Vulcanimicrobiota bacterium]
MPTLLEDFLNPAYFSALWSSIAHGLKVLMIAGVVGALFTFTTGGTQPKHWAKSEH